MVTLASMGMLCAVSFNRYGRLYYFDPAGLSPQVGDRVLIPTDDGTEVAECVWAPQWVSDEIEGLPVCEGLASEDDLHAASAGWPAVMANLKSLLEIGHTLPQAPWEMHAELRAAQMARTDPA